ncbi:SURF1 family protein [Comamonas endophytica]|uniref:SURF1-like protein n=1 Tax=Comamonas endophytica TaxID=2949090 RepID=A0ABY6G7I4_9BURK|nr:MULTISPECIES: SURF1 family protein [unclassified Acidovorax]MCD2511321.1 SURF1 family protein [Acidovorax sp. D4N7]UYG50715.1 SURF1 family protein [Acidovorax sp. 5MLIR]
MPAGSPLGVRFWLITLAAAVGIAGTAALGRWQLDRAAQKQALAAAIEARGRQAPLDAAALHRALIAAPEQLVHRPVALQGRWLPQHTVYLDNRQMQGRPGFFVLTPLQLGGPEPAVVLVQRGWIARNFQDRTALAPVQTPAGQVMVAGRLAPSPARLYEMASGADPVPAASPIRQNLDLAAFRRETGLPLLALSVVQTGADSEGLQRQWPRIDAGVGKHHGYAFQWFGLSALMAVLYVWFQIFRRFHSPHQSA